jgi:hypothetical protein
MKDGHLFLALMADGGIYEFEPLASAKPQDRAHEDASTYRWAGKPYAERKAFHLKS